MRAKNTNLIFALINLMAVVVVFTGWWPVPGSYFLLEPALFCSMAMLCLLMLTVSEVRVDRRSLFAYGAFTAWVVLSDALSGEFLPALARDVHWLILPLLVVLYTRLFARGEDVLKVLQVAIALSLIIICYRLIDGADGVVNWVKLPIFGNIRRLAMTVGLMSVFLYRDAGYRQSEQWLFVLARITGLGLLFWSGSRGAILSWLFAFLTFVCLTGQWSRLRGWLLEVIVAVALALWFDVGNPSMGFLNAFSRRLSTGTIDGISSGRLTLWLNTLDALREPGVALFGAGGNGFVRLRLMFDQIFHPHNIGLQALVDWGAVGFLLLLWLVRQGMPERSAWRASKDSMRGLGAALMVFLLLTGLLDGGLYHLQYLFFAAMAFALTAKPIAVAENDDEGSAQQITVSRLGIAGLLFAAMFLHWVVRDYRVVWPVTSHLNQSYAAPQRG
ncbi:MAG: O-antigen ligase family protein [Rugosibacter sp.]|nr:O-antigen ligase family protein [Rugosibacter sp.]